jgi:hypothetical protein
VRLLEGGRVGRQGRSAAAVQRMLERAGIRLLNGKGNGVRRDDPPEKKQPGTVAGLRVA